MSRASSILKIIVSSIILFTSCAGEQKGSVPRSAVIVLIDTCRFDEVGKVTAAGPVTPNLDRFREGATSFSRCSAPSPWTLPSTASILTGVYPTIHGALGRYPDFTKIRSNIPTGQEILSSAGFRTGAFVNVAFLDPVLGLDRGFDTYDYVGGSNRKIRRAAETFEAAAEWIDERKGDRFFLVIHLFDPHMDYDPPKKFANRFLAGYEGERTPPFTGVKKWRVEGGENADALEFAHDLYRAEIAAVDEAFGRFIDRLDTTGPAGAPVIIVTADHGEEFGEHGGFEHGHTLFEELIHVPLIIRIPGARFAPDVDRRVSLVDVMPTLFDLLDVPPPGELDGESLMPLLMGKETDAPRYRFAEGLLYGEDRKAVIGDRYKYILGEEIPRGILFDLDRDPSETRNLVGIDPEKTDEMNRALRDWLHATLKRTNGSMHSDETVDMEKEVVEQLRALGYVD